MTRMVSLSLTSQQTQDHDPMLFSCLRRCFNIKTTLSHRLRFVLTSMSVGLPVLLYNKLAHQTILDRIPFSCRLLGCNKLHRDISIYNMFMELFTRWRLRYVLTGHIFN